MLHVTNNTKSRNLIIQIFLKSLSKEEHPEENLMKFEVIGNRSP